MHAKEEEEVQKSPSSSSFAPVPCVSLDPYCYAPQFLIPEQPTDCADQSTLEGDLEVWPPILSRIFSSFGAKRKGADKSSQSTHCGHFLKSSSLGFFVYRQSVHAPGWYCSISDTCRAVSAIFSSSLETAGHRLEQLPLSPTLFIFHPPPPRLMLNLETDSSYQRQRAQ